MFDFFKKKNDAVPIFGALGTDMHCHLVPGVDDGSKSFEESKSCIQTMWSVGYRKMYITPHFQFPRFQNDEEDIATRYQSLVDELHQSGVEMEFVGVGGEYRIDDGFSSRMENPKFLTLKDNRLLVELSLHQPRMGLEETLFDLQMKGYELILAHPERYPYLSSNSTQLERLKEMGVMFQVNVLSLGGFYGEVSRREGYKMIGNGWVELLGTDMHNLMYADALRRTSHDKRVQKLLEKVEFQNKNI